MICERCQSLMKRISSRYDLLFLLVFGLGLFLRIVVPTFKLLHHDEAIHAWFSYELITKGTYLYDPMYHGPLLYYLTGAAFSLFGDSDLVVRLLPGVFGACIIPLIYGIYRLGWLDRNHAIWAVFFVAISPDLVYFSRFLRHDIFQLFFTVLLVFAVLAYLKYGRFRYAALAGVAAACGLCLKEDMPFTLFIFGSFFLVLLFSRRIRLPVTWIRDLAAVLLIGAAIGFTLYSSLWTHPEMFFEAPFKAIAHWTAMHDECRLCGPPYWYLLILGLYEIPLVVLALYNVFQWGIRDRGFSQIRTLFRPDSDRTTLETGVTHPSWRNEILMMFAIWWAFLSLCFYGYIGEKVPWLIIHQLPPLILLATYRMDGKKVIAGLFTGLFLVIMMIHVCFTPGDINEPIVQVQNSEDLRTIMALIDASDHVVVASESYWPLPWYYRGEQWKKISFYGGKVDPSTFREKEPDLVMLHDSSSYDHLEGYEKQTYKLSYWFSWFDNQNRILEWYLLRDGKTGSVNLDLFITPGLENLTGIRQS